MTQASIDAPQAPVEPESVAARLPRFSVRALTIIRRTMVIVWAVTLVYWVNRVGLTFDRNTLLIYVVAGLLAGSIGTRGVLNVLRDWLPFILLLLIYDLTRGAAEALGRPTQWHLQLDFDKWLFGGIEPTVWLQAHLKEPFPPWWETLVSLIYVSYFFAPYAVAGVLWLRDRSAWRRFAAQFVAISFIGLVGFVAFPAAPPWAAAQCSAAEVADRPADPSCIDVPVGTVTDGGMLGKVHPSYVGSAPYIERVASRGWNKLGIPQAKALVDEGQAGSNQVAAVPSLHAAISGLLVVFFWPRVRKRWRPLLAAYGLAMAFSLVYGAEQYVFDILLGWLLTAVVSAGCWYWDRRRANTIGVTDTLDGSIPTRS